MDASFPSRRVSRVLDKAVRGVFEAETHLRYLLHRKEVVHDSYIACMASLEIY